jgi:hypothetical protein
MNNEWPIWEVFVRSPIMHFQQTSCANESAFDWTH